MSSYLVKKRSGYLFSALLTPFVFTPLFIKQLHYMKESRFYISAPGPIYYVFFGFFAICMWEVLFCGFDQLRKNSGIRAYQLKYITFANCLAIFAGFEYFSRVFGLFKSPPIDDYILVIYTIVLAFSIVKYRLFNVEEILEAFQRERLATVGLMAASMTHEIRNPLYVIKGVLETYLANEQEGIPNTSSIEISRKVLDQVQRVFDTMRKFADYAKPASYNLIPSDETASIHEAMRTVLDFVSYQFDMDKFQIRNYIASDLSRVHCSQSELEKILCNLIVNAFQAVTPGGSLTISSETDHSTIRIMISDTGAGISMKQQRYLFKPFHTDECYL